MKVTIDTVHGVVSDGTDNGIEIQGVLTLTAPSVEPGEIVTTTAANVTKGYTIVATIGNCTLILPNATTVNQQQFKVKKNNVEAYTLTIQCYGSQTIDGESSLTITAKNTAVVLYALQGNWYIF
jgi:hypothetical protein